MKAEKPIAVYSTSRKGIIFSAISTFAYLLFGLSGKLLKIANDEGTWFGVMIAVGILIMIQTLYAFNSYTIIEILKDRVTLKNPIFKRIQTVKFEDFQRLYFYPSGQLRYLVGHYRDKKRKMLMAEFAIKDYTLFENYEEMILKLWTIIPCKKLIFNKPAEENDIYEFLKADKSKGDSLITRLPQNF